MSKINYVEIHEFTYEVENLGPETKDGIFNICYKPGHKLPVSKYAVAINTDDGCRGEYVTHWVGTKSALAQSMMLAPYLIGQDPEERESIFDVFKQEIRMYDHMGHGPLDIAL